MKAATMERNRQLLPYAEIFYEFLIFSFLGFLYESLYGLLMDGSFQIRGSLEFGLPIIQLYGLSIVLTYHLLKRHLHNPLILFAGSSAITTLLELATTYIEEYLSGRRSWNYADMPLNYQGRISLFVSLVWGASGLFCILVLYPRVQKAIRRIPPGFLVASSILIFGYLLATNLYVVARSIPAP